jgi:hypothetical protein
MRAIGSDPNSELVAALSPPVTPLRVRLAFASFLTFHRRPRVGICATDCVLFSPRENGAAGTGNPAHHSRCAVAQSSLERQLELPEMLDGRKRRERELILLPPWLARAAHDVVEHAPAVRTLQQLDDEQPRRLLPP